MAQGGLGSLMMQTHIYENGVRTMAEKVGVLRMQPSGVGPFADLVKSRSRSLPASPSASRWTAPRNCS